MVAHEIDDYLGLYSITDEGTVINLKTGNKLKIQSDGSVSLRKCGNNVSVKMQYLMDKHFQIPAPTDGNKRNNRVSNLEWVTVSENIDHAWRTGLNDMRTLHHPLAVPVRCIQTGQKFESMRQAANFFQVDEESFRLYMRGEQHSCPVHGYSFELITKEQYLTDD